MEDEDMSKCHFVPSSTMENAIQLLNDRMPFLDYYLCKRNLCELQKNKLSPPKLKSYNPSRYIYHLALSNAIYSHNWDKLLYLLKKAPIIQQYPPRMKEMQDVLHVYIRALIILLMNHPSARAKGLLHEYMHMVCSCRTDAEKKALMRLILTLPEKLKFRVPTGILNYRNDYD